MQTINKPYIKQYDESGKVLPLENGVYLNESPNRKQRRELRHNKSFTGNHKGMSLTVSGKFKYERVVQVITNKLTGVIKRVNHYLAIN